MIMLLGKKGCTSCLPGVQPTLVLPQTFQHQRHSKPGQSSQMTERFCWSGYHRLLFIFQAEKRAWWNSTDWQTPRVSRRLSIMSALWERTRSPYTGPLLLNCCSAFIYWMSTMERAAIWAQGKIADMDRETSNLSEFHNLQSQWWGRPSIWCSWRCCVMAQDKQ